MNTRILTAIERILLTLWIGALWATGFIVAPVLFAEIGNRALAGTVAGSVFTLTSYLGLFCGGLLLLINAWRFRTINWRINSILAMLLLVVVGQFVITPMVAELRVQGLTDSTRFGQLHAIASVLFLMTSGLGLLLVAVGQKPRD